MKRKSKGGKTFAIGIDNWNVNSFVLNKRVATFANTRYNGFGQLA
ncbi:hypothetical protein [Flavobacterium hydrophilum]|nr:hypothetical protein [Flavobacterium hydrophilum]